MVASGSTSPNITTQVYMDKEQQKNEAKKVIELAKYSSRIIKKQSKRKASMKNSSALSKSKRQYIEESFNMLA